MTMEEIEKKREEEIDDSIELTQSLRKLCDTRFEKMIIATLSKYPIESGYDSRCYCRRCNASWDMTSRGIKRLKERSPNGSIILPEEVTEQDLQNNVKKFFFIIEPCFRCRDENEKIMSEVRPIPFLNGHAKHGRKNGKKP